MAGKKVVGPIIQAGEMAEAVLEAARLDNEGSKVNVVDRGSYIRIQLESECILRRKTIEKALGRPFRMTDLEVIMPGFEGRIDTSTEQVRFYSKN
jgi:toluene monooxygenase system protein D|tara:strand:- start:3158 stop:3442 length:285 start_codon:yes stop_codon:yes gene_type:complete